MNSFTRKLAVAVSTIAVAIGGMQVPTAVAQDHISVAQGDLIYVKQENGRWSSCSVGYVDSTRNLFFTAGHCANTDGAQFYLPDAATFIGSPNACSGALPLKQQS